MAIFKNHLARTLPALALAGLFLLAGCGDSTSGGSSSDGSSSTASSGAADSSATNTLTSFTAEGLDGKTYSQDYFAQYDLTIVQIWGTFCSPCIREMPDMVAVSQQYADQKVGIIGIVIDTTDVDANVLEDELDAAKKIVKETGADGFPHLIPSKSLIQSKLQYVTGTPETVLVDKTGKAVKIITGMRTQAQLRNELDAALQKVAQNG